MKDWLPLGSAFIAGAVAVVGYVIHQYRMRQERKAAVFAEAIMCIKELEEMPYRIAKRQDNGPASVERLGNSINDAFVRLSYFQAWIRLSSPRVARAFDNYSRRAARVGEDQMRRAWREPPLHAVGRTDSGSGFYYGTRDELDLCVRAMRRDLRGFPLRRDWNIESQITKLENARIRQGNSIGPLTQDFPERQPL
jgi:hypothetical protein